MTARHIHNTQMRSEMGKRDGIRALFLKQHLPKLRPFVTPQVALAIEQKAATAPHDYELPEPVQDQPPSIKGEMREYQLQGLQWLVRQYDHGINAILADEMGLGKTLQTIAFLAFLTYERKVTGPHLVVVPLSVLPNWMAEFKKFAPDLRVVRIHVNDEGERRRLREEVLGNPQSFDIAVTTYDMVNSVHFGDALKHTIVWRYVVLDEGHRVKNEDALISQGMRQVNKHHVLMLTGTPVQNNLHELFALLNFMFPDVFTSAEAFDRAFNLTSGVVDNGQLEAAHYLLRPFMLRRVKDEVECKLPPKLETRINCPLSEFQTFWYRRLLLRDCDILRAAETGEGMPGGGRGRGRGRGGGAARARTNDDDGLLSLAPPAGSNTAQWNKMMNLLMQLRKVCNHPYLFNIDAEPDFDGLTTGEDIVESSGKMQVLDRLLVKLKAKGHRVVLFSQFSKMLDILEDYIRMRNWRYKRLDGSTNRIQRMIDIQQFNKPNSDIFMYILCTRAGGLGVNLQTADTCILFDSDWNPQQDLQAMARVHRIGQNKPVHVYRLVSEGTVEERIQKRAEGKLYLDQMVNRGSTRGAEEMERMSKSEVLSMLKFGADRIFKNDAGRMMTDAELEGIIDRSALQAIMDAEANGVKPESSGRSTPALPAALPNGAPGAPGASTTPAQPSMFADGKHSAADFHADDPPISTFEFAGTDYKELRQQVQSASLKEMASMFWEEKRRRTQRIMRVGGYDVLREDNYTMDEGGISATSHLGGERHAHPHHLPQRHSRGVFVRKRRQLAGEDYEHNDYCQVCWDGGDLLCCDFCPVSIHPKCLGMADDEVVGLRKWGCPHHSCVTCGRNTAASGGLLFRCEMCEQAFCEDHLPENYEIIGENETFQSLGQTHPKQACFILCSEQCQKNKVAVQPQVDAMLERYRVVHMEKNRVMQEAADEADRRAMAEAAAAAALAPPAKEAEGKGRKRGRYLARDDDVDTTSGANGAVATSSAPSAPPPSTAGEGPKKAVTIKLGKSKGPGGGAPSGAASSGAPAAAGFPGASSGSAAPTGAAATGASSGAVPAPPRKIIIKTKFAKKPDPAKDAAAAASTGAAPAPAPAPASQPAPEPAAAPPSEPGEAPPAATPAATEAAPAPTPLPELPAPTPSPTPEVAAPAPEPAPAPKEEVKAEVKAEAGAVKAEPGLEAAPAEAPKAEPAEAPAASAGAGASAQQAAEVKQEDSKAGEVKPPTPTPTPAPLDVANMDLATALGSLGDMGSLGTLDLSALGDFKLGPIEGLVMPAMPAPVLTAKQSKRRKTTQPLPTGPPIPKSASAVRLAAKAEAAREAARKEAEAEAAAAAKADADSSMADGDDEEGGGEDDSAAAGAGGGKRKKRGRDMDEEADWDPTEVKGGKAAASGRGGSRGAAEDGGGSSDDSGEDSEDSGDFGSKKRKRRR